MTRVLSAIALAVRGPCAWWRALAALAVAGSLLLRLACSSAYLLSWAAVDVAVIGLLVAGRGDGTAGPGRHPWLRRLSATAAAAALFYF